VFHLWSLSIVLDDVASAIDADQTEATPPIKILRNVLMVVGVCARLETATRHAPVLYSMYQILLSFNVVFIAFALIECRSPPKPLAVRCVSSRRLFEQVPLVLEADRGAVHRHPTNDAGPGHLHGGAPPRRLN